MLVCRAIVLILLLLVSNAWAGDLVLYLDFEEASGNLIDKSGYGNDCSIYYTPTYQQPGAPNRGYSIKADSIICAATDSVSLNITGTGITLQGWMKLTSEVLGCPYFFKKGAVYNSPYDGYSLFLGFCGQKEGLEFGTGTGYVYCYDTGGGSLPLTTSQWYYVAGTYDGTKIRIYRQGMLIKTCNQTASITSSSGDDLFIRTGSIGDIYLDDLKIYNYALTPIQIQHEYQQRGRLGHLNEQDWTQLLASLVINPLLSPLKVIQYDQNSSVIDDYWSYLLGR